MKGVMLVTDRALCGGRALEDVVLQAVAGGVCAVQLREKKLGIKAFIEEALAIKAILAPHKIPLIVNDRVDVALAVDAAGVHIGQSDMPPEYARRILGPDKIIGLSVETWEDVEQARMLDDVDYLGVSPVFSTPTKTDTKAAWGLSGLTRIRAHAKQPLVAIGGINNGNAGAVVRAGADCIAVVSAICAAPDPRRVVQDLAKTIEHAGTLFKNPPGLSIIR